MESNAMIGKGEPSQNSTIQAPKRALAFIFSVAVLDLLGLTLLIPVIPFLVRQ